MAHLQCDERKITTTIPRVHPPILGFTPGRAGKKRVMLAGWSQVVRVTLHCLPSGNRSLSMLDEGQRGLEGDRIAWKWR